MNLSYEIFIFAVYQIIILGVFIAVLKKILECKPNPENVVITFGYLDRLLNKQKEEIFKEIEDIKIDIDNVKTDLADIKKQLIELLKSQYASGK